MIDDVKAALRSLRASPTFTAVALLVLTLGIGATTAIFSVVDAVVLRALPFDEHDRLVAVGQRTAPNPNAPAAAPNPDPAAVSASAPQNYADWAARQTVFESMAAMANGAFTLREAGGEPEELRAQRVTADFFKVLREHPARGRAFTAAHEVDGRHQVAVLSDGLWRRRFNADPDIVGKTIPIEGGAYEVVGVMAPEFAYPVGAVRPTDLWVPFVVPPDDRIRDPGNVSYYLSAIARLKPGVSIEQAQANLDVISAALTQEHPAWNRGTLAGVRPLHDHIVGARTRQWMLMLLGAVGIVLLIACANVANLLLARASGREREVGIRAALGAGRWRLIRGFIVESLVLSAIGTALAILAAWWGVAVLKAAMPDGIARVAAIAVDLRVLGASAALALITGVLAGIVPALQASRPQLTAALKEGGRGTSGGARHAMRNALVIVEVALSVVLLVGAALFIGSFRSLMKIDPGFDPENVLTVSIQPRLDGNVSTGNTLPDYAPQLTSIVERIAAAPGVVHAAVISGGLPMGGGMSSTSITVPGRIALGDRNGTISIRRVSPDYHQAMGIPLRDGRHFDATDSAKGAPVAMINESAAKVLFPGERAVGKTIGLYGDRTIVGVVGDVYQLGLETEPRTEAYVPIAQRATIFSDLIVRTSGDPYAAVPAVKAAVLAALPDVPLRGVRSMEEVLGRRIAQRRLNMLLLGLFGLLGLVISAAGIYGVMAYLVAQRTREIGVRIALGAPRWSVVRAVMTRAAWLLGAGLAIGGAAAWALSSTAQTFLFRMDVTDPRAYAAAVGVLAAAGLLASAIPARRAASVDPMIALRQE